MDTLIEVGGIYCIALVVFHLLFWKVFRWNEELPRLNRLNRAVMQVLNLSLTFVFVIFSYVSLVHASELLTTDLGQSLLCLISVLFALFVAKKTNAI